LWQIKKQILEAETDLGTHKPVIIEFYKYFENNYFGYTTETRVQVGTVRRGRMPVGYAPEFTPELTEPIFPIRYWNVFTVFY